MDKMEVKFEEDIDELQNDDFAIVLRPNFKKNKWDGKVSIKNLLMPVENLSEDEKEILLTQVYALEICFDLLNTNAEFRDRIYDEIDDTFDNSNDAERETKELGQENRSILSKWSKTFGSG